MIANIVFCSVFIIMTLSERNVYQSLASNYCLRDLPSAYDRYIYSFTRNIPIDEISDQVLRDMMRSEEANEQVRDGFCKR